MTLTQSDLEHPTRRFVDPLPGWTILRPAAGSDGIRRLELTMRTADVQLHRDLPPTRVWTYGGSFPGPLIEVPAGERVEVAWRNHLYGTLPVAGAQGDDAAQRLAGTAATTPDQQAANLKPWTVVHQHGGRTEADSDGWAENVFGVGDQHRAAYRHDRGTLLWYHDHAAGATRLNVFAGLAGPWAVREAIEEQIPRRRRELFLLLRDCNLETRDGDPGSPLTGQLLHKTGDQDGGAMEFFGPFTMVNGKLWPRAEVRRARYRVRLLNGSNARTYRLRLLDDAGQPHGSRITVIGSDGGLLPIDPTAPEDERQHMGPVPLGDDEAIQLAPAERIDLIIDFRSAPGDLRLVNDAFAPYDNSQVVLTSPAPGCSDAADPAALRAVVADVVKFSPAGPEVEDHFDLDHVARSDDWPTYRRMAHDRQPFDQHEHRLIGLVESSGVLTLHELYAQNADSVQMLGGRSYLLRAPFLTLVDRDPVSDEPRPATTFATAASAFEDAVTFMVMRDGFELWRIINLTEDTHPFHIHLVRFQVLARVAISFDGGEWDATTNTHADGQGNQVVTVADKSTRHLESTEWGWKDTVRVNPMEMVSIMARFDGHAGRFMYHCHVLEHEDHDMMRPFAVLPHQLFMPGMRHMA